MKKFAVFGIDPALFGNLGFIVTEIDFSYLFFFF